MQYPVIPTILSSATKHTLMGTVHRQSIFT